MSEGAGWRDLRMTSSGEESKCLTRPSEIWEAGIGDSRRHLDCANRARPRIPVETEVTLAVEDALCERLASQMV